MRPVPVIEPSLLLGPRDAFQRRQLELGLAVIMLRRLPLDLEHEVLEGGLAERRGLV